MSKFIYLAVGLFLLAKTGFAQTNVELIDQLVTESESEYGRQVTARNGQATVTTTEDLNKSQLTTFKRTYRDMQHRFHTLGLVISAAQTGIEAAPMVTGIVRQQQLIFELCKSDPALALLAARAEADLAGQADLLIRYGAGLLLSIGDLNQMKASDRKMLFSYVVSELRRISGASLGLLTTLKNYRNGLNLRSLNPFSQFISADKQLANQILRNTKTVRP